MQYQQICRWFWTRERFIDIELAPVWRCLRKTEDSWQQCRERQHGEMQNWAPGAESLHSVAVQTGSKWLKIIYNFHHLDMLPSWDSWTPRCSVLMSLCYSHIFCLLRAWCNKPHAGYLIDSTSIVGRKSYPFNIFFSVVKYVLFCLEV